MPRLRAKRGRISVISRQRGVVARSPCRPQHCCCCFHTLLDLFFAACFALTLANCSSVSFLKLQSLGHACRVYYRNMLWAAAELRMRAACSTHVAEFKAGPDESLGAGHAWVGARRPAASVQVMACSAWLCPGVKAWPAESLAAFCTPS